MTTKTTSCRILDALKIAYTLHEYSWSEEELDVVTVARKVGILPSQVFKTLVLKGDKSGVMLACIPGDKELNSKSLANVSGNKKAEMVSVKDLQYLTGYKRGGVSPLGGKKKYPLYIDESIQFINPASISAGRRGIQIFLNGEDLLRACQGSLVCSIGDDSR